jgi:hypothetical protein
LFQLLFYLVVNDGESKHIRVIEHISASFRKISFAGFENIASGANFKILANALTLAVCLVIPPPNDQTQQAKEKQSGHEQAFFPN